MIDLGLLLGALLAFAVILTVTFVALNHDDSAGRDPISDWNEWGE